MLAQRDEAALLGARAAGITDAIERPTMVRAFATPVFNPGQKNNGGDLHSKGHDGRKPFAEWRGRCRFGCGYADIDATAGSTCLKAIGTWVSVMRLAIVVSGLSGGDSDVSESG